MKALVGGQGLFARIINIARKSTTPSASVLQTIAVPTIADDQVLVKVAAVAINPTDWKHADMLASKGAIIGCDYSGTVAKVGANAPGNWSVGDRIAGAVHGGLYQDRGAFAEYLKTDGDIAWRVPESVSDEAAASYGISSGTAAFALNAHLEVPWLMGEPGGRTDTPVLIYAGSTGAGIAAIQVAKAAGLTVITTCSPHSFDLVKSYGADAVFDYKSPSAVDEIKKAYPNIDRAMDCISEGKSAEFCAKAMGSTGGKVITLLPEAKANVPGVTVKSILLYTCLGKEFQWFAPLGPKFAANLDDKAVMVRWCAGLGDITDKVRAPPLQEVAGGLEGINSGLAWLREGKISGKKLVVKF